MLRDAKEERKRSLETFCTKKYRDSKDGGVPSRRNFLTQIMKKQRLYDKDAKASRPVTLSDTFLIRVGIYESLNTYMTHRSRRQEFLVTNKTFLADLLNHPSLSCLQDMIDALGEDDDKDDENTSEDEILTHPRHLFIEGT